MKSTRDYYKLKNHCNEVIKLNFYISVVKEIITAMQQIAYPRKEVVDFIIKHGYASIASKNKDVDRVFEVFIKFNSPAIEIVRTLDFIQHTSLESIIGTELFNEWCK